MIVSCLHCNKKLERKPSRVKSAKRGNFCCTSHQSSYYWKRKIWDETQVAAAHRSIREKGRPYQIGRPLAWVISDQRDAVRKKISDAKKQRNWMKGRTGALHHHWCGGTIWWRGKDWDSIKYMVRVRDEFKCVKCGQTEEENISLYGQPLQVDHIIPYRISQDNDQANLQTLCNRCHGNKIAVDIWLIQNSPDRCSIEFGDGTG